MSNLLSVKQRAVLAAAEEVDIEMESLTSAFVLYSVEHRLRPSQAELDERIERAAVRCRAFLDKVSQL